MLRPILEHTTYARVRGTRTGSAQLGEEQPRNCLSSTATNVSVLFRASGSATAHIGRAPANWDFCVLPLGLSFASVFAPAQPVFAASDGCRGTRSGNAATGTDVSTAAGARSTAAGCGGAAGDSGAGSGAAACSTGCNGSGGDAGCGGARSGRAAALGRRHMSLSGLGAAWLRCTPLGAARLLPPATPLLLACPPLACLPLNCQPPGLSVPPLEAAGPRARGPAAAATAGGGGDGLARLWPPVPPAAAPNPRNLPPPCTLAGLSRLTLSSCSGQTINCAGASAFKGGADACARHVRVPARGGSTRRRRAHTTRNPACRCAHQHFQRQAWPAPMPRMERVSTRRRGELRGGRALVLLPCLGHRCLVTQTARLSDTKWHSLEPETQWSCHTTLRLHSATFQPRSSP